jgi:hypothetical protein
MSDGWQDYTPKQDADWQDYQPDQKRSAASPIAAPKLTVGAPASQPAQRQQYIATGTEIPEDRPGVNRTMESLGALGGGALKSVADVTAPVIAHRIGQRAGVIPPGDAYQGEGQLKDVPGKAVAMMAGGLEGPEAEIGPSQAAEPKAIPVQGEAPGMAMRVAKVFAHKIPGVKLASDLADAVRGPEAPPIKAAPPTTAPIPQTEGIPWGSGGQGPISLRGKAIPQAEAAPVQTPEPTGTAADVSLPKVPVKVVRQAQALGPNARVLNQAAPLGRAIPEAVEPPVSVQPPTKAIPDMRVTDAPRYSENSRYDYQASGRKPTPYFWEQGGKGRADMLDDRAVQQDMQADLDKHERIATAEERREFAARNSMDTPKGELIRQSRIAQPKAIPPADLTPEWQRALDAEKAKKAAKNAE